jgi:hypothetical protein
MTGSHPIAVICLLATLISGCTSVTSKVTSNLPLEPKLDSLPQVSKKPINVGIYYSPQFVNQEFSRRNSPLVLWVAPIGGASTKLFDNVLSSIFEKTTQVSDVTEEELTAKGVDVAIAPSLEY